MIAGVWTNSWWTGSSGLGSVSVGLRELEVCFGGVCQALKLQGSGTYSTMANLTFFVGLLSGIGLLVGAFLQESQDLEIVSKWSGSACGIVALAAIMTLASFPGREGASLGWGFWATIFGALMGAYAGHAAFSGGTLGGGKSFEPIKPWEKDDTLGAKAPIAVDENGLALDPTANAAAEPAAVNVHQHRSDLTDKVKDATAVAKAKGIKQRHRVVSGAGSVANAAVDSTREHLRFVIRSCDISEAGISVIMDDRTQRDILFTEIERLIARRLPPDPPFEKTVFVDIMLSGASAPIRLLPSTRANYGFLPGSAMSSKENMRSLAQYITGRGPASFEPESADFFTDGKAPPLFMAIKQFADYDAQYQA
jgi:hypothetical protein